MAIVVEDGSVVDGANSYVTEAELTQYATDRALTLTGTTEALLIKAMDYLDSLDFIGVKYTRSQSLQWPRQGVVIDGYTLATNEIPSELKKAQMTIALSIDAGNDPLATIGRAVKKEKLADLEVEYQDNAASTSVKVAVSHSLRKLLRGSASAGGAHQVIRA